MTWKSFGIILVVKTQIITLESHDDLISVRDRMSWAKTPRILLVWPKYEKVTLRQVDLKVLQRHALSLGAQLGLVTRTRHVREEAAALNIPIFEFTGQAQRVAWPTPRRKKLTRHAPRKDLRAKREQASVGEAAVAFTSSSARCERSRWVSYRCWCWSLCLSRVPRCALKPVSKTQSITLPVTASTSIDSVFISGSIPAREKRVVVEGEHTVVVTGEGIVAQSKAKGIVEFRNLTQQAVTIPVGSVVQSVRAMRYVRFVTTGAGEVDAGVGKTIELPIEAVEGGLAGQPGCRNDQS